MERRSRIPYWAAAVILVVVMNWAWRAADAVPGWFNGNRDISVYLVASESMRAGGDTLYDKPTDPGYANALFVYPPSSAALMALFYVKDRDWTLKLWLGITVACLVLCAMLAWAFRVPERRRWEWIAIGMGIACAPVWSNLWWGQVNVLLLAVVVLSLVCVSTGRPIRGGLMAALAAHIKILPGALLLVFAFQRNFRAALATLAGLVLWIALPLLFTVPAHGLVNGVAKDAELHVQFIQRRVLASPAERGEDIGMWRHPTNSSLPAATDRILGSQGTGFLLGLILIVVGLMGIVNGRSIAQKAGVAGLVLFATQLANPVCWPHHLCLLPVLVVPLYECSRASPRRSAAFWVHVGALLLGMSIPWLWAEDYFPNATLKLMEWCVPTFLFVAGWFVALALLLTYERESKQKPGTQ